MLQETIDQGTAGDLTVDLQESGLRLEQQFGNVVFEIGDLPAVLEAIDRLKSGEVNEEVLSLSNGLFTLQDQGEQSFAIEHDTGDRILISSEAIEQWLPEIRNQL